MAQMSHKSMMSLIFRPAQPSGNRGASSASGRAALSDYGNSGPGSGLQWRDR
jgi:hypothetical protein